MPALRAFQSVPSIIRNGVSADRRIFLPASVNGGFLPKSRYVPGADILSSTKNLVAWLFRKPAFICHQRFFCILGKVFWTQIGMAANQIRAGLHRGHRRGPRSRKMAAEIHGSLPGVASAAVPLPFGSATAGLID